MQNQNTLVKLLKDYDSQSIPFAKAKNLLLQKGYSDAQIARVLYQFSYDGKPNVINKEQPVTQLFAQNPKEAQRVADYISNNHKDDTKLNASINYAASQFAVGDHAKSYYSFKFAQDINYPFFTMLSLTVLAIGLFFVYNLPKYVVFIPCFVVSIFWFVNTVISNKRK